MLCAAMLQAGVIFLNLLSKPLFRLQVPLVLPEWELLSQQKTYSHRSLAK